MDDSAFPEDEALIDAVVHGEAASDSDPLATQLRALRDELCQAPSPDVQWNHVAAMRRAARTNGTRRPVRTFTLIAAATVGVLGVTTGLAAADRLPVAVQDPVARVAGIVGIDLPKTDTPHVRPADRQPPADVTGATTDSRGKGRASAGGASPGNSAGAPGHADDPAPGNSGATPGDDDATPGHSANAPGHNQGHDPGSAPPATSAPGNSANAPGRNKSTDSPSQTAPGQLKKSAAPENDDS